jgi:hypothetical protein
MNRTADTRTESTQAAATTPVRLPSGRRVGSAVASVLVSGALFGAVVFGMTSMGDAGQPLVAQAAPVSHA